MKTQKTQTDEKKPEGVDAETYEEIRESEVDLTDSNIVSELLSRFDLSYGISFRIEGEPDTRYKPREDSYYIKGKYQQGYYVNYAFPKGRNTPVASVWTKFTDVKNEERFKPFHIDLEKLMNLILLHYTDMGYFPPNPEKDPDYDDGTHDLF